MYFEKHEGFLKLTRRSIKKKKGYALIESTPRKPGLLERIKSRLKIKISEEQVEEPKEEFELIEILEPKIFVTEKPLYSRSWKPFIDWNTAFRSPTYLNGFKNIVENSKVPSEIKEYLYEALEFVKEDVSSMIQICEELTSRLLDIK